MYDCQKMAELNDVNPKADRPNSTPDTKRDGGLVSTPFRPFTAKI